MSQQAGNATTFGRLHADGIFVVASAWDVGTARLLTGLAFPALATTSGGLAFTLGRPDGTNLVTREATPANAAAIATGTALPVTADREDGFERNPEDVAT
jgi:2-methylisocitrate lyase-like PEP mutase family enzyme